VFRICDHGKLQGSFLFPHRVDLFVHERFRHIAELALHSIKADITTALLLKSLR